MTAQPAGQPDDSDAGRSPFREGVQPWVRGLGRLRDVVRQRLVAAQLREVLAAEHAGAQRVLDVGCGQGTQALALARAGHHVTGLDPSPELLARFQAALDAEPEATRRRVRLVRGAGEDAPNLTPGPFEVVLCHGVLMYLDDTAPTLQALTSVAAQKATLSLLIRNGLAPAMRDGLRGNPAEALAAFDRRDYVNRLGLPAHAHTPADLDRVLVPLRWRRERWYGVRVFCDHRDEDAPEPAALEPLLAAEHEAARRDPYRQVAALLHVLYTRHPEAQ
ncbi:MAG: class I SAM-dependent methyltransferase [Sciscionella sp.]